MRAIVREQRKTVLPGTNDDERKRQEQQRRRPSKLRKDYERCPDR